LDLLGIGFYSYFSVKSSIPDTIHVREGDEGGFEHIVESPLLTYEDSLEASGSSNYNVECKLLNLIPLKNIKVEVVDSTWVAACGTPIGLYMETQGVMIINAGEIIAADGLSYRPAEHIVQSGDYILEVNGTAISDKKQLIQLIHESNGETMQLVVNRKGEKVPLSLTPLLAEDNMYKLGIWVRDNTQGIGTVTYVDASGNYGALGHGISDIDTGELLKIENGELYKAEIYSVMKGTKGNPGELTGIIDYNEDNKIGSIDSNSETGIFGNLPDSSRKYLNLTPVEVGFKQEAEVGKASVLTTVEGAAMEYEIEITEIFWEQADTNKAFAIQVTDPRLLAYTGGIVQGMSGSPILQNGKIIGAVTHVFVQDSTCGYGIFIENMMQ